ncbi:MAG: ketoacyl-ACP synthase III [Phycisphaerae bacterium]|nr:ketoacyl-ACP synthase III [Gemmatimonadaceae bacterium]
MKRPIAYIAGTGHSVPKRAVSNLDLQAQGLDTDDAWIFDRTGIRQRYIADESETLTVLSAAAARIAMQRANIQPGDIDVVIVGTATPDHLLPATAVEVQSALGASRAMAFDVSAACSGWLYGMQVAEGLIATGMAETVLVVGGEILSSIVDWTDRNTCVLFGDGAGATILRHTRTAPKTSPARERGILSSYARSDGSLKELLWRPSGGVASPFTEKVLSERTQFVRMQGREVFKHAVRSMADASQRALDLAKLTSKDIDVLIPHQANVRIIEATAKLAGIPMEKVFLNVEKYANTSAGSIPIALDNAMAQGRITEGTTVMFVAFGAGFTWGSLLVRF